MRVGTGPADRDSLKLLADLTWQNKRSCLATSGHWQLLTNMAPSCYVYRQTYKHVCIPTVSNPLPRTRTYFPNRRIGLVFFPHRVGLQQHPTLQKPKDCFKKPWPKLRGICNPGTQRLEQGDCFNSGLQGQPGQHGKIPISNRKS